MVFALLTPIAIEPVIAELDPPLVMLGAVGSAKQVAEGVNTTVDEQYSLFRQCVLWKTSNLAGALLQTRP